MQDVQQQGASHKRGSAYFSSQQSIIANHLRDVGDISPMEAIAIYRVSSITKVISVLREKGMDIEGTWRKDNTGKRYRRYFHMHRS